MHGAADYIPARTKQGSGAELPYYRPCYPSRIIHANVALKPLYQRPNLVVNWSVGGIVRQAQGTVQHELPLIAF